MDKHLPFINELEKTILAAFLQDRSLWVSFYEHLKPNFFNTKEVGILFSFFTVYFKKYRALPEKLQTENFITNKNLNDKKMDALIQFIYNKKDNIEKHEIKSLYDEIFKFIKETKMEYAILSGVDLLKQENYDKIEEEIRNAVAWNPKINLGIHIADVEKRYEQIDELYENVIETPWPRINALLGGGIFQKTLTIFAAASSVGKSIALDQTGFHIWDKLKKHVVVITLEVSEIRKGMRMDSYGTQIPISEIRDKRDVVFKFYEQKNDYKNKLFIKEFPTSSITTAQIEQYLYHLELFQGIYPEDLGAIIIDYGDIMLPLQRTIGKTYEDVGNAFENLRSLSQTYGPPVISASQINRSGMELSVDDLTESKLADSIKKMFIADNLIALVSRAEDRMKNLMFAKTLKARDGIKDQIITLGVDYARLTINDRSINIQNAQDIDDYEDDE